EPIRRTVAKYSWRQTLWRRSGGTMGTQKVESAPTSHTPIVETFRAGELLKTLRAFKKGDFTARVRTEYTGVAGELAQTGNDVIELAESMGEELARINNVVGKEGKLSQRALLREARGNWVSCIDSVNELIADLVQPTTEVGRVIGAVATGDLSQTMTLEIEG